MKAILRVATSLAAAALAATSTVALAQAAPASNSTSPEIISAPELQNFSLKGTVTRPADVTPAPAPARSHPAEASSATAATPRPARVAQRAPAAAAPAPRTPVSQPVIGVGPTAPQPVMSAPARANATQTPGIVLAPAPAVPAPPAVDSAPANHLAPFRQLPLWPWILAAIALLAGGAFLLWRRWPRRMAVAGPQFDLLVPSAPEPQPESLPRPPAPAGGAVTTRLRPAMPSGVVASRLRPTLELGFHPLRCQVDDDQVAIEFELELFNAGTAPARAVLAEASMLNASVTQDQELAAFFSKPNGSGERLAVIQPLKRVSFRSQVVAPRNAVQEYELAGRKTFVPVIAFNALYEWSGGKAQSSAAYLVGRDTRQDKLGPLRLDQGAREFRELGARPLPAAVRT